MSGERFEQREGVADMDYHMSLVERGGAAVNKKSFVRWRRSGVAFRVTEEEGEEGLGENVTLVSGGGTAGPGYWGDICTGPFLCHGEAEVDNLEALVKSRFRSNKSVVIMIIDKLMDRS